MPSLISLLLIYLLSLYFGFIYGITTLFLLIGIYYATKNKYYLISSLLGLGVGIVNVLPHHLNLEAKVLSGRVTQRIGGTGAILKTQGGQLYLPNGGQYIGCEINTKGRIRPTYEASNPGGFSEKDWLLGYRIYYVWQATEVATLECNVSILQKLHQYLKRRIEKLKLTHTAEIQALILGRSASKPAFWYQMGIIHLLSISGLHIQAFIRLMRKLLGMIGKEGHLIPHTLCYGYLAFLDYGIPASRAWLMTSLRVYQDKLPIRLSLVSQFILTLAIIVTLNPHAFWDIGAYYSFSASLVMMLCQYYKQASTIPLFIVMSMVSIGFGISVEPISLLANILIMPIFSYYIFPILLITILCIPIPNGFEYGLLLLDAFFEKITLIMHSLSLIMNTHMVFSKLRILSFMSWLILRYIFKCHILWGLLLLVNLSVSPVHPGQFKLSALNCGHGLCLLIQTQKHTLLYDIGSTRRTNIATSVVIPYLNHEHIASLDRVVISHPDHDHFSGLQALLYIIPVKSLYTSIPLSMNLPIKTKQYRCQQGDLWEWDGVVFSVLHPNQKQAWQGNNQSCVIKVSGSKGSILLTGDIEKPVEIALVQHYPHFLESDILLIPHHGSKTSSSPSFLKAVNPNAMIISENPHKIPPKWQNIPNIYNTPYISKI